jgi:hypothetical protein
VVVLLLLLRLVGREEVLSLVLGRGWDVVDIVVVAVVDFEVEGFDGLATERL